MVGGTNRCHAEWLVGATPPAKTRYARMGFRQSGQIGFGLRRQVVDSSGRPKGILQTGEHKYLHTDRIVQVRGPAREVAIVRWMYREVADYRLTPFQVAVNLNQRGIKPPSGRPWTKHGVLGLLRNEKYMGTLIYNRTTARLRGPQTIRPESEWIRIDKAYPALVSPDLFRRANDAIKCLSAPVSNEAALDLLRRLLKEQGRLTAHLIDAEEGMPSVDFYRIRFGSLVRAYRLVGFTPRRDFTWLRGHNRRWHLREALRREISAKLEAKGVSVRRVSRVHYVLGDRWRIDIRLVSLIKPSPTGPRWFLQIPKHLGLPDFVLAARLAGDNETILDYWLLSGEMQLIQFQGKYRGPRVRMRFETLDSMLEHVAGRLGVEATRTPVPTAPMKGGARSERIRRIRRHLAEGASKCAPNSALVGGT